MDDVIHERRWIHLMNRTHHRSWGACRAVALRRRVAGEWRLPGYHFVKHHAETPDIGALINVSAARLLRRHITNGSQYRAEVGLNHQQRFVSWYCYRHFLLGKLCDSKVEHF